MTSFVPSTINGLLEQACRLWPDRPYLQVRAGETMHSLTYREVTDQAQAIAHLLIEKGVRPGDRVALLSENRPAWVISYLAILCAGATVVPIDSLMSPAEIVNILKMAQSRLLMTTKKFAEAVTDSGGETFTTDMFLIDSDISPSKIPLTNQKKWVWPNIKPADIAVIIFTSGTTGFSKGVVLTHQNLCSDVQAVLNVRVIQEDDNFLLLLPLHHTFSSTVNMLGTLALGAKATFATSFKSRDIVDDIRISGVTLLVGVPQVFENIMNGFKRAISDSPLPKRMLFHLIFGICAVLRHAKIKAGRLLFRSVRAKAGLGTLRNLVSGGAALRPEVNHFFERMGFTLLQGYGLTETSPVLTCCLPQHNRIGSVGRALPGVVLKIDNVEPDGVGEICARGPMIMHGYFENPDATAEIMRDGWFHTGDAGYLDPDGYLYITGRIKNVIVTGAGKNVHPETIESVLNLAPFILESLVLGVQRKRGPGEELAALIVPDKSFVEAEQSRGHNVNLEAEIKSVVSAYNHSVPAYRRIRQWKIREEELEKTSTRKVKRYLYQHAFQSV
ncbi:long-chain fatty acid--CoA ligase [candidate division KSB1 bacterium]|nr:MAG: long-chain fatty acid--CoA ligase [candidate division KSB1 bacterium]